MKALSIIIFCSMLINAPIFSQSDQARDVNKSSKLDALSEKLNLTDDQILQLEDLFKKRKEEFKHHSGIEKEERKQKHQVQAQSRESFNSELEKILTEEQFVKFKSLRKEKKKNARTHGKKNQRKEFREFGKQTIHPEMREWRAEFEGEISIEDRATIEELRSVKKEMRTKIKVLKETAKNDESFNHSEFKKEIQKIKEEFKSQSNDLKELVEKYKEPIKKLFDEHKAKLEEWKSEFMQMKEKHNQSLNDFKEKGRNAHSKMHKKPFKKNFGPAMFLLLDPNASDYEEDLKNSQAVKPDIKLFPNPSNHSSQAEIIIPSDGFYRLELIDDQGNLIQTVVEKNFTEGKYSEKIDLSNLKNSSYYIRLIGPSGVVSKTLLLQQ